MKKSVLCVFACMVLLSGCGTLDSLLSYDSPSATDEDTAAAPPPAAATSAPTPTSTVAAASPAAAESPNAGFCRDVATQDATSYGFDQATQQRVFARSYAQCLTIHGS